MIEFLLSWTGLFLYWIPALVCLINAIDELTNTIKHDLSNRSKGSYNPKLTNGNLLLFITTSIILMLCPIFNVIEAIFIIATALKLSFSAWFKKPVVKPNVEPSTTPERNIYV